MTHEIATICYHTPGLKLFRWTLYADSWRFSLKLLCLRNANDHTQRSKIPQLSYIYYNSDINVSHKIYYNVYCFCCIQKNLPHLAYFDRIHIIFLDLYAKYCKIKKKIAFEWTLNDLVHPGLESLCILYKNYAKNNDFAWTGLYCKGFIFGYISNLGMLMFKLTLKPLCVLWDWSNVVNGL